MKPTYRLPQEGGIFRCSAQPSILLFRTDKRKLDDLLLPRIQDLSSLFDVGNRVTLLMLVRIFFIRQFSVIVAVIPIVFVILKKKAICRYFCVKTFTVKVAQL
jgi:hypothetical protein